MRLVVSGHLIAQAVRRMTWDEARRSLPELTKEQHAAIVDGLATFRGNSEEGVEFVDEFLDFPEAGQ